MDRDDFSNWKYVFIGVLIILFIAYIGYRVNEYVERERYKESIDDEYFSEDYERRELQIFIDNIGDSLIDVISVVSSDNNSINIPKNIDILKNNKQLFIMRQLSREYINYILVNPGSDIVTADSDDDIVLRYYPYSLFILEYSNYFDDEFDINSKISSKYNTIYDNSNDYIYYNYIDDDMCIVDHIDIDSVSYSDEGNIAVLSIVYDKEYNMNNDKATMKYKWIGDKIKILSFVID